MTKQHTSYDSAFAIGECALLSLDNFGQNKVPYGVVEGCMAYGEQRMYRVSLFVNDGPESKPNAFLHQGRPVDGFLASDLKEVKEQYVDHIGHVGRFEQPHHKLGDSLFISGQLVEVDIDLELPDEYDKFNIPVVIMGVTYVEGKVLYEVSIQRAYYKDGRVNGGRLVRDTLSNIDSIYIKPMHGWPKTCLDSTTMTVKDGTVTIAGAANVVLDAPEFKLSGTVTGRTSGLVENQSAEPLSK